MELLYFLILCFYSFCDGFVLSSNILSGPKITDQHYIALFDQIGAEQHARRQLQSFIIDMQKELVSMKQEVRTLSTQQNNECKESDILNIVHENDFLRKNLSLVRYTHNELKSEIQNMTQNFNRLQINNSELQEGHNHMFQDYSKLLTETIVHYCILNDLSNKSSSLNHKFYSFLNSTEGIILWQLHKTQEDKQILDNQLNSVIQEINHLNRITAARTQDFLAFIKEITNLKRNIDLMELGYNSLLEANDKIQNETLRIKQLAKSNVESKKVAVTGCGTENKGHDLDSVLKFSSVSSTVGIADITSFKRTGYFTTEEAGLYIISATLMSYSKTADFYVYKNNQQLAHSYIAKGKSEQSVSHTGSVVLLSILSRGDKISVRMGRTMHVYGPGSCLTVISM